jgi:predicted N-acetyltransferase YhbS
MRAEKHPMSPNVLTRLATPSDAAKISALHEHVFGPGRFARSAYRVREGKGLLSRFCRVADLGGHLVAALRLTEISIGGTPAAALLGPLAVDPDFIGRGIGTNLVSQALDDLRQAGIQLVLLVGDEPYYGRFGFKPVPLGQIVLPGPVNPQRLLALELEEGSLTRYRGLAVAAKPAPPATSGKG